MLAQTLVLIAMLAVVAASAVAGIAGYARAESAIAAKALVRPAMQTALARYESSVVVPAIVASLAPGDGSAAPAVAAALNGARTWDPLQTVVAGDPSAPLVVAVTVTPTSPSVPACDPSTGSVNTGNDTEQNGQCSPFVQESRLSLALAADAGPPSGPAAAAPLAHGRETVTLRLFAQPPYVMVAGIADDAAPGDAHEGDAGGYGNAAGTFGPSPAPDDTTIHVIFACTPGQGDCSASLPVPVDRPTSLPWTNGNASAAN